MSRASVDWQSTQVTYPEFVRGKKDEIMTCSWKLDLRCDARADATGRPTAEALPIEGREREPCCLEQLAQLRGGVDADEDGRDLRVREHPREGDLGGGAAS